MPENTSNGVAIGASQFAAHAEFPVKRSRPTH
ncbi:MAG: hypothetical protein QOJ85_3242 [Solirubrobacteraceae bacterium]|jgi:hypothetical protein|nr:hypothetical protein [Solirubrobacteraceae bacterium]MEA2244103.1 hypothetical protein [Solirubrobacteraceae bacterium]